MFGGSSIQCDLTRLKTVLDGLDCSINAGAEHGATLAPIDEL